MRGARPAPPGPARPRQAAAGPAGCETGQRPSETVASADPSRVLDGARAGRRAVRRAPRLDQGIVLRPEFCGPRPVRARGGPSASYGPVSRTPFPDGPALRHRAVQVGGNGVQGGPTLLAGAASATFGGGLPRCLRPGSACPTRRRRCEPRRTGRRREPGRRCRARRRGVVLHVPVTSRFPRGPTSGVRVIGR